MQDHAITRGTVIGGGAFGTAMGLVMARKGAQVSVWVRHPDQAQLVNETRINARYLPGVELPPNMTFTSSVEDAVKDSELVVLAVPTQFLRSFLVENRSTMPVGAPLVLCAKGIEVDSLQTPYEILRDELPGKYAKYIAVLAGPSFAKEIAAGLHTAVSVAADDPDVALRVQHLMSSAQAAFRCYRQTDILGCEIAGAMKNVLAIASGAAHGLGLGNNSRAGLICRGLSEIHLLAKAMGSTGHALHGLAGVGDLTLTCSSELSRNFTVGSRLAKGETLEQITATTTAVAEGVATAKALHALAQKLKVELPICSTVYSVLYQGTPVKDALKNLFERPLRSE